MGPLNAFSPGAPRTQIAAFPTGEPETRSMTRPGMRTGDSSRESTMRSTAAGSEAAASGWETRAKALSQRSNSKAIPVPATLPAVTSPCSSVSARGALALPVVRRRTPGAGTPSGPRTTQPDARVGCQDERRTPGLRGARLDTKALRRNDDVCIRGRHEEASDALGVRSCGGVLEAGVEAFPLLAGGRPSLAGGPGPRGTRDHQRPFDRLVVAVEDPCGHETAIGQLIRLKNPRCFQRREVPVNEGHDGIRRGGRRRGPDLQAVGAGERRRE